MRSHGILRISHEVVRISHEEIRIMQFPWGNLRGVMRISWCLMRSPWDPHEDFMRPRETSVRKLHHWGFHARFFQQGWKWSVFPSPYSENKKADHHEWHGFRWIHEVSSTKVAGERVVSRLSCMSNIEGWTSVWMSGCLFIYAFENYWSDLHQTFRNCSPYLKGGFRQCLSFGFERGRWPSTLFSTGPSNVRPRPNQKTALWLQQGPPCFFFFPKETQF